MSHFLRPWELRRVGGSEAGAEIASRMAAKGGLATMLLALLGELHFLPSGPDSWYSLPRGGGVAYAAQESWVLNDTIKVRISRLHSFFPL